MLVEIQDLCKYYELTRPLFSRPSFLHAVERVSLSIDEGETLGIVGESGCGKTTLGRSVLRLIEPTSGDVRIASQSIVGMGRTELFSFRKNMQMVFQDPYSALNPVKTVYQVLERPIRIHKLVSENEVPDEVTRLLESVELSPGSAYLDRLPNQLSGGQRQRVVLARAIALRPKFIVADEPVSSLDANVKSRVLELMINLQREMKICYLFITHDIFVAHYISTRIAVMYLGEIIELADAGDLIDAPQHPYTVALLSSVPIPDADFHRENKLVGEPPSLLEQLPACKFYARCPYHQDICKEVKPQLEEISKGHLVACHFARVRPVPIAQYIRKLRTSGGSAPLTTHG